MSVATAGMSLSQRFLDRVNQQLWCRGCGKHQFLRRKDVSDPDRLLDLLEKFYEAHRKCPAAIVSAGGRQR